MALLLTVGKIIDAEYTIIHHAHRTPFWRRIRWPVIIGIGLLATSIAAHNALRDAPPEASRRDALAPQQPQEPQAAATGAQRARHVEPRG